MPVVLDTSFLIDVSRKVPAAVRALERFGNEGEHLLVPTVVAAEYLTGSRDTARDLEYLEEGTEILSFTIEDALAAAAIAQETLADGTFPGWTDCFIAGFAKSRGDLEVTTANPRHFPRSRTLGY